MKGIVVKNTGSQYVVLTEQGTTETCRIKGSFRIKGIRTTNPVAVGDEVEINEAGFITRIAPRRNYVIRKASNLSKEAHILAANVDQAMLVVTLTHPETSLTFIDRFLATCEAYNVPAIIVVNKIDLIGDVKLKDFVSLYESIGYKVIPISAKTGQGLERLKDELSHKLTLISGNSGVGKSTIINELAPEAGLETGMISQVHDTGMHTTTFSEMFQIPGLDKARVIDTPGIKGFGTLEFDIKEVSHYFPELFAESKNCRFNNCTHTHEPGCAVIQAVKEGRIPESRFMSYLSILEDENQDKYREPF